MRIGDTHYVRVPFSGNRLVRARWGGGAYVELTFDNLTKPSEVLNVWDDETNAPKIDPSGGEGKVARALIAAVRNWAANHEEEGWTDWYENYLENARY